MKVIKCFCVFTFAFIMNAEVFANTPKVFTAAGLAVKEDIKVDFGEGIGETKDEALKEAIRDVLQRVVGTYVDSDFRVENDKIIKDQIITHSNGFIERYKIMDTDQAPNGRGIQVTIKAWVKIRDFVNRMKGIAPAQRVKVDGLLLNSELENKHSAEKLIENVFEKLDPINDLLEVKLVTNIKPIVQDSTDDSVTLRYIFIVKYSYENYYKKFLPRVISVLDQVAVKPARNFGLNAKMVSIKRYPHRKWELGNSGYYFKDVVVPVSYLHYDANELEYRDKNSVSAVVKINKGIVNFREWQLSTRLKKVLVNLLDETFPQDGSVDCKLRLLDSDGCEITQGLQNIICKNLFIRRTPYKPEFIAAIPCGDIGYDGGVDYKSKEAIESVHFGFSGRYMDAIDKFVGYVDVVVAREDILRIKSAEIKLDKKYNRADIQYGTGFNLK